MTKIFIIISILFSQLLFSQTNNFKKFEESYSNGNITEAIIFLKKSIENNEKNKAYLYATLGDIYKKQKSFKESAVTYEKMLDFINLGDQLSLAYFHIGTNYYFAQEYLKAIEYLEKTLELGHRDSGIANNLGWCYSEIKDYKKAIKYFEMAFKEDPELINNINNLGYAYYLNSAYKKAEKLILEAKDIDENNSFVYRNLGLIAMKKGKKEKACNMLEKSIEKGIIDKWGKIYVGELIEYCGK